jgi:TolA-binding protein
MDLIKKYFIWILLAVCVIVLIMGQLSGANSKIYNMVLDQLRDDQSKVVDTLETQLSQTELQIADLQAQRDQLRKEKEALLKQSEISYSEIKRLEGERHALQQAFEAIVAPSDLNSILLDLKRLGISSIRIH